VRDGKLDRGSWGSGGSRFDTHPSASISCGPSFAGHRGRRYRVRRADASCLSVKGVTF
jgi:hypothetical protein